ncbi:MAG TPA: phosphocholine cytidylyltransferase family protein [Kofleriaceae bacterium]|jgi:choline kinase|nr:phosphocholine cytidylyltransferase family protein [Kofleriaceae bacterium]
MKAVILAAGCATRLRPHSDDRPKTLLPVGGVPILRRTITSLLRCGFDQFVIGTGYLEHMVREAVASWFPTLDVTFVTNPDFRTTNNGYSLMLCAPHVENDAFILLDGDVVFDVAVVEQLVQHGPDCLAVRSVGGIGLEEVKVTADSNDRVLAIGKHVPVRSAMGESVGIELFSASSSKRLFAALDLRVRQQGLINEYYEASFQQIIDDGASLYGVDMGSLYATEIDTIDDLMAANARLAAQPAFDTSVEAVRLAV